MSAMAILIASACISSSGVKQEACEKGLQAGTKQFGIEKSVNILEDKVQNGAKLTAYDWFGKTGSDVLGGTIFLAKSVKDKSVSFGLPTLGIANRITTTAGVDVYRLNLEWRF